MGTHPSDPSDFVLTATCVDRPGIVHAMTGYLVEQGANINECQQFEDPSTGRFFIRLVFRCEKHSLDALQDGFTSVATEFGMEWGLWPAGKPIRALVLVSKLGHCLNDLLFRQQVGSLPLEIVAVGSNHLTFQKTVATHDIPFHHIPVTAQTKAQSETRILELVQEYDVELVVLARYMQVLSDNLCRTLEGRAINIHHSFLPSFKGARPYHQAHDRGVKLIGATAHYVTPDLDEGPIIEQDVARIDHTYSPDHMVVAGRDVETQVLARALTWHAEHRVFLNDSSTVVLR